MIFIPTYNPNLKLFLWIKKLTEFIPEKAITIINDGSQKFSSKLILNNIKLDFPNIKIINFKKNLGKGKAIKEALILLLKTKKATPGIFVDDDGQHDIYDVKFFYANFLKTKSFVIGQRTLSHKKLPIASYIGNKISSILLYFATGKKIYDTQCGLRVIPKKIFNYGIKLKTNRFDYEFEFLIKYILKSNNVVKKNIKTIYFANNKNTKFKKIIDSQMVLWVIFSNFFYNKISLIFEILFFILLQILGINFFISSIFSKFFGNLPAVKILFLKHEKKIRGKFSGIIFLLISAYFIGLLGLENLFLNLTFYIMINFLSSILNFRIFNFIK